MSKTIIYILLLVDKYVLPVITSFPAVALNLVSPVRRCLVRHWYVFFPSSLLTFLICSSSDGKTTYFPSCLKREERTLGTCYKLTLYDSLIYHSYHKISYYFIKIILFMRMHRLDINSINFFMFCNRNICSGYSNEGGIRPGVSLKGCMNIFNVNY